MGVSIASIFLGYMDARVKAKKELERSVEATTTAIGDVLQVPLWTYDQETIENIGNIYSNNEDIAMLTIVDSLGQTLFHMEKPDQRDSVHKKRTVMFEGKVAGTVDMALSSKKYRNAMKQLLLSGLMTMGINLTVLIIVTGFLLRLFLKNPLNLLSDIVDSYSAGNYAPTKVQPYIEFQPFVDVLRAMGGRITRQIDELSQAERKFRGIFENAVEGIFQVSPEGKIVSANPSMAIILGYDTPEEMIEKITSLPDQCFADRDDYYRLMEMINRETTIAGIEIQGLKRNGETFWFTVSARTVLDPAGNIHFFEGSIMDISDRKEREEAERRQKAADAANQAKTLFIARMSHELRTPLNSVLGMTELLMDTQLTKDQAEYISLLQSSGEFLESIINDILDFSKIEAQQLVLDSIPFDIYKTVEDAAALLRVRAMEKDLDLIVSIDPDIPPVLDGDPVRLKQILVNILGNAVKFTRQGSVKIEVDRLSFPDKDENSEELMFRVSDTGIGIPESKLDMIFDSFTQADSLINRQFGGTGLGLSICRRLVGLMGGALQVSSTEGEGSTFFFTITLKHSRGRIEPDVNGMRETDLPFPNLNILLVDDIEPNRTVIHRYLQKSSVHIIDAVNGQDAVDKFAMGNYDLVLMDVEMPVMNGLDATRRIRKIEKEKNRLPTPLIILSAHAFGEQREQCFEAGCNALLVKPIRKKDLIKAIVSMIKKEGVLPVVMNEAPQAVNPVEKTRESGTEKVVIDVMFEDLLKGFFDYFKETLENMDVAVRDQDFDDLYRLSHGLKGSARNYGFFKLGDIFFEIEKASADRNMDLTVLHMREAVKYLETVEVEFADKG
jgi:PAS domain S-box-containing protein